MLDPLGNVRRLHFDFELGTRYIEGLAIGKLVTGYGSDLEAFSTAVTVSHSASRVEFKSQSYVLAAC